MADINTVSWQQLFEQVALPAPNFLSGFFTLKSEGVFNSDKVSWDVVRDGEDIATPILMYKGGQLVEDKQFTNKEVVLPKYLPAFMLRSDELKLRLPGQDPYSAEGIEFGAKLMVLMARKFRKVYAMIVRALELQASQILTTGKLSIVDADNDVAFSMDFKPKATHFITAGTAWTNVAADAIGNIAGLCDVIMQDGQTIPKFAIFGKDAMVNFFNNTAVKASLDLLDKRTGSINMGLMNRGAIYFGNFMFGTHQLEIWAYNKTYKDPVSGNATQYLHKDKVIIIGDEIRLDRLASRPAFLADVDPRLEAYLPERVTSTELGFDVVPNIELKSRRELQGELETNMMLAPIQIDGFGCLTTV